MNATNTLSLLASTFAGGSLGWLEAHVQAAPTTGHQVSAFAAGATLAGMIAVFHLFQPVPGQPVSGAPRIDPDKTGS